MTASLKVNSIAEVLADYQQGKMVIMVDDKARENEGDLLIAGECITAEHINFMASHGKGLICLALSEQRCNQLALPLMVSRNHARFATNFTVSIEAATGVTTGISAPDRAVTIQVAVHPDATANDIVSPGHIFPIKAQPGGVLTRAGHTEAGVDLARLSGFEPASVICEILKADGTMARLPDLVQFAAQHQLKIGTIADLIRHRLQNEPTIARIAEQYLPLAAGQFRAFVYRDTVEGGTHLALVKGEIVAEAIIPVRVHVQHGLLDALHPSPPGGWTLPTALAAVATQSSGVVVILGYHETAEELVGRMRFATTPQRPSKADSKATARAVPVEKNLRMLGAGGQILADLGIRRVLALGRRKKAHGLSGFNLEIVDYVESPEQLRTWGQTRD